MLSAADAALVRRDPAVSGLGTLLDPNAFLEALGPALPSTVLLSARPTYLRYKPATNCLAAYRLETDTGEVTVYAKAHGPDASVKLAKARQGSRARAGRAQAHYVLADHAIVVWFFPWDGKLRQLRRLADPASRAKLLDALKIDGGGTPAPRLEMLAYKPERRFVARLERAGEPASVLKFYTPQGFRRARCGARAFAPSALLRIPRCNRASEERGVLGFEWLEGRPLAELLAEGGGCDDAVRATGAALATLHAHAPGMLPLRTRGAEVEALLALARWMSFVRPRFAKRASRLAAHLARWLAGESPVARPVHGDFYAKQVQVNGGEAALLDLDEAGRGDPRSDLGLFVAHLELDAMRGRIKPDCVGDVEERLLEGYRRGGGEHPGTGLREYAAVGLFQLLHSPFRTREPDWDTRTEALLDRIEECIARPRLPGGRAASPMRPVRARPGNRVRDPKMPWLARALDPVEAERRLGAMLRARSPLVEQVKLLGTRVVRHKPGRRCLVEYEIGIRGGDRQWRVSRILGKTRARGLDGKTWQLSRDLWRAGFDERSPDGISVPEPIGAIPAFQMWFQARVRGVPATEVLEGPGGPALAARVADALAKLQGAKLTGTRRHTLADEMRILKERLSIVAKVRPAWKPRIERLLSACLALARSIPAARTVPVHRDFYPDQILVDGDRLTLVDLDLCCEGDPALDAGNFLGHLKEQALRALGDPDALASREEALVARFLALTGREEKRRLEAYTTLTLARHVHISTLFPERRPFTAPLLSLCEARLRAEEETGPALRSSGDETEDACARYVS